MKFTLKTTLLTAALSTALLGASAFAVAQNTEKGPSSEMRGQHMAQRAAEKGNSQGKHRVDRMARMQEQQAQRQDKLKAALKLTPEQEAAWSAFVVRTAHEPRQMGKDGAQREDWSKLTTPERLDKMQARHAERTERMTKRIDATKSFYAALSPEQQKVFDTQGMRGMGGMHQGGKKGHGHHMGKNHHGGDHAHGQGMHKAKHMGEKTGQGKNMVVPATPAASSTTAPAASQ